MLKLYNRLVNDEERKQLWEIMSKGVHKAQTIRRAHTLILVAEGWTDVTIAEHLHISPQTVALTRRRFTDEGLEAALHDRKRPGQKRVLDGRAEAFLVATACSAPPDGRRTWTMQLLADRLVTLGLAERCSDETVRRTLKKTRSSPG